MIKLMKMLKWNWHTGWSAVASMYGCLILINLLFTFAPLSGDAAEVRMGALIGMDTSWILLGPILGGMLFSYSLRWGGTNGMSRRFIFLGYLLFAGSLALATPLCTFLVRTIFSGDWWNTTGIYNELFGGADVAGGVFLRVLGEYIWSVAIGLCTALLGYLFSGIFYRLGKLGKLLLCAGTPIVLFVLLPLGSLLVPKEITQAIGGVMGELAVYLLMDSYRMALLLFLAAGIIGLLSWLVIRRAPIRPTPAS